MYIHVHTCTYIYLVALRAIPPPCLGHPGSKLGGLGAILAAIWEVLGPSWLQVGGSWGQLGSKNRPKWVKNLSWRLSWGVLEGSWGHLGPKRAPRANKTPNSHKSYTQVTPSWGPFGRFWEPCWSYVGILEGFWKILDTKLEAKLTKKLIKWPLVGKLAEKAKMVKNHLFFKVFWSLGLPTSRPNWPKIPILGPRWAILGPRWGHVGGM